MNGEFDIFGDVRPRVRRIDPRAGRAILASYGFGGLALGALDPVFRAVAAGLGFGEHLGTRFNIWLVVCLWVGFLAFIHPRVRVLVCGAVLMCLAFVFGLVAVPGNVARWGFVDLVTSASMVLGASLAGYLIVGGVALAFARWVGCVVARPDPGRCAQCDYPLMGLPGPRCPECGTPFRGSDGSVDAGGV